VKSPAGKTRLITVSSIADSQVLASMFCNKLRTGEDPSVTGWPTTDFLVRKPKGTDDPRQVKSGGIYEVEGVFGPGDVVLLVRTKVGSTTFFIDEEQAPMCGGCCTKVE